MFIGEHIASASTEEGQGSAVKDASDLWKTVGPASKHRAKRKARSRNASAEIEQPHFDIAENASAWGLGKGHPDYVLLPADIDAELRKKAAVSSHCGEFREMASRVKTDVCIEAKGADSRPCTTTLPICKRVIGDRMPKLEGLLADMGVLLAPKSVEADVSCALLCSSPSDRFLVKCSHVLKGKPSWTAEFLYYAVPAGDLKFPFVTTVEDTELLPGVKPTARVLFETDIAWRLAKGADGGWQFQWVNTEDMGCLDTLKLLSVEEPIDFGEVRQRVAQRAACNTALKQLKRALMPWWATDGQRSKGKGSALERAERAEGAGEKGAEEAAAEKVMMQVTVEGE